MQYTTKYQHCDKTHAIHNQISTKQQNPCYTQPNINKAIKPMQYTTKYQQSDKTHAIHNQISTKQ